MINHIRYILNRVVYANVPSSSQIYQSNYKYPPIGWTEYIVNPAWLWSLRVTKELLKELKGEII